MIHLVLQLCVGLAVADPAMGTLPAEGSADIARIRSALRTRVSRFQTVKCKAVGTRFLPGLTQLDPSNWPTESRSTIVPPDRYVGLVGTFVVDTVRNRYSVERRTETINVSTGAWLPDWQRIAFDGDSSAVLHNLAVTKFPRYFDSVQAEFQIIGPIYQAFSGFEWGMLLGMGVIPPGDASYRATGFQWTYWPSTAKVLGVAEIGGHKCIGIRYAQTQDSFDDIYVDESGDPVIARYQRYHGTLLTSIDIQYVARNGRLEPSAWQHSTYLNTGNLWNSDSVRVAHWDGDASVNGATFRIMPTAGAIVSDTGAGQVYAAGERGAKLSAQAEIDRRASSAPRPTSRAWGVLAVIVALAAGGLFYSARRRAASRDAEST